ncbi:unnamed protein product [Rotaria sp. Silwood2]|nr:unnamed protein product [Rotaria sp. Silwood2]
MLIEIEVQLTKCGEMSVSSSSPTHFISIDPRIYCETMNELHSYITSSKRGYLTQAELFRYYRQRHDNAEIPYRLLGYRSLLDLLSSDQRLFAIDLRREPAYIYSAVKLRQQKRERRRMFLLNNKSYYLNKNVYITEGGTSFSRQHHSTNTLDEQHVIPPDYVFFDHHVPLNEQQQQQQQQQNFESTDEQEQSIETQNERPLTPNNRNSCDNNIWHTPQLDEQSSLIENKINSEESNQESIQFTSNPFLLLPTVHLSSEIDDTASLIKCENQYKPIQRKIIFQDDHIHENKCPIIRKLHENLKQEIRSLLISSPKTKYGGLSGSLLYSDYKTLNSGKEIPYGELGFHSFLALLRSMPDVVRIEYKENSPSYRVHPVYDETIAHIQKMVLEQRDKYEYQNQIYNQNWHSNKYIKQNNFIPSNFYNNEQLPYLHNSLSRYTWNNFGVNVSVSIKYTIKHK